MYITRLKNAYVLLRCLEELNYGMEKYSILEEHWISGLAQNEKKKKKKKKKKPFRQ